MSRHAFIVGGTGQIGRAVAADLLERGWRVTASHRGNRRMPSDLIERGAKIIVSDRETPGELARALSSGADAVIDAIAFRPDHARELIEVQDNVRKPSSSSPHPASIATPSAELSTKLRRMVFPELTVPITESHPTVDPNSIFMALDLHKQPTETATRHVPRMSRFAH